MLSQYLSTLIEYMVHIEADEFFDKLFIDFYKNLSIVIKLFYTPLQKKPPPKSASLLHKNLKMSQATFMSIMS